LTNSKTYPINSTKMATNLVKKSKFKLTSLNKKDEFKKKLMIKDLIPDRTNYSPDIILRFILINYIFILLLASISINILLAIK